MNLKALAQLPFLIIFKNNNKKKIKDKEINAAQMCFFATWTAEEKDWIYWDKAVSLTKMYYLRKY